MKDKHLAPLRALVGSWTGSGQGPQGPFNVRADFEERGRWLVLSHAISPPGSPDPFYVSTQVFGYGDDGLTLDYFDTAGSFHFQGGKALNELTFSWKKDQLSSGDDLWKDSSYSFIGDRSLSFKYRSCEAQKAGESAVLEFKGELNRT
jgi:hypothetical protein